MRQAAYICFAIALLVALIWVGTGARMVTVYQVPKTRMVEDAFGDKVEKTKMVDDFKFGLLPDKGYDGALPWIAGFISLGVGLVIASRFQAKSEDRETEGNPDGK